MNLTLFDEEQIKGDIRKYKAIYGNYPEGDIPWLAKLIHEVQAEDDDTTCETCSHFSYCLDTNTAYVNKCSHYEEEN